MMLAVVDEQLIALAVPAFTFDVLEPLLEVAEGTNVRLVGNLLSWLFPDPVARKLVETGGVDVVATDVLLLKPLPTPKLGNGPLDVAVGAEIGLPKANVDVVFKIGDATFCDESMLAAVDIGVVASFA